MARLVLLSCCFHSASLVQGPPSQAWAQCVCRFLLSPNNDSRSLGETLYKFVATKVCSLNTDGVCDTTDKTLTLPRKRGVRGENLTNTLQSALFYRF